MRREDSGESRGRHIDGRDRTAGWRRRGRSRAPPRRRHCHRTHSRLGERGHPHQCQRQQWQPQQPPSTRSCTCMPTLSPAPVYLGAASAVRTYATASACRAYITEPGTFADHGTTLVIFRVMEGPPNLLGDRGGPPQRRKPGGSRSPRSTERILTSCSRDLTRCIATPAMTPCKGAL